MAAFRWHLLLALVALLILLSGALLVATYVGEREEVADLSRTVLDRTVASIETGLSRFFREVERELEVMGEWGRHGRLTTDDPGRLVTLIAPLLRATPAISSAMVANGAGDEWMLLEAGAEWRSRVTRAESSGENALWSTWSSSLESIDEERIELDYDPRTRPWFIGAQAAEPGDVHWTSSYVFFTTRDPGVTAATRFAQPGDTVAHRVVALDVLLLDISRLTTSLDVSDNGTAFVLTDDGRILGLPRDDRFADPAMMKEAILSRVDNLDRPDVAAAVRAWPEDGRGGAEPFPYEADGERWWAVFHPFPLGDQQLWIGVTVPAADFLGDVTALRRQIAWITAITILLAAAGAFWLARFYARPLEQLATRSRRMARLDLARHDGTGSRIREVADLAESQDRMRDTLDSFSRYVPIEVVRQLLSAGTVARIGGEIAEVTLLFSDIEGFTTIAEGMEPERLTNHMAEYFEIVIDAFEENGATVDKILGDAVMAFWGAPVADADHAANAVAAALQCRDRLIEASREWGAADRPMLPTTFGLHTGEAVVGNIGAPDRLGYTALGDSVNLASRIQGLNRVYGTTVLASGAVRDATARRYAWRLIDRVVVKGKGKPVHVFEPLGLTGEVASERLEFAAEYETALEAYVDGRFENAIDRLEPLPMDRSVRRLLDLCRTLAASPPDDDWEPVTRMEFK